MIFSGSERAVYDTSEVEVQKGIHVDSVGFGLVSRAVLEAGRTYTFPDLDRQIILSPLGSDVLTAG